jgi:hypothetical protein
MTVDSSNSVVLHRLPTFFVVGPPRTTTTWLYEVIKGNASLPRYTNEVHFFNYNYSKGVGWYLEQFDSTASKPRGDICSTYFYSAEAKRRIKALVPEAKIVCTFREPIERIFSLYRAKRTGGIIPWSFEEALFRDSELLESSKYGFHLSEWIALFGRNNVLCFSTTTYRSGLNSIWIRLRISSEYHRSWLRTALCKGLIRRKECVRHEAFAVPILQRESLGG